MEQLDTSICCISNVDPGFICSSMHIVFMMDYSIVNIHSQFVFAFADQMVT